MCVITINEILLQYDFDETYVIRQENHPYYSIVCKAISIGFDTIKELIEDLKEHFTIIDGEILNGKVFITVKE